MLRDFVVKERASIIERARSQVAARTTPRPTEAELRFGVPLFLDQFAARLLATTGATNEIGTSASQHGAELLHAGFTIGQVVHDYGDICQAITTIAVEQNLVITTEEFRALNMCLDVAIAEAVTQYSTQRETAIVGEGVEHLGFLAHELRNLLNTATLAVEAVRSGAVGISGSTGRLLDKSLDGMRDLVSRSLAEVRLEAGPPPFKTGSSSQISSRRSRSPRRRSRASATSRSRSSPASPASLSLETRRSSPRS
jgi:signal transduction histidine kinase